MFTSIVHHSHMVNNGSHSTSMHISLSDIFLSFFPCPVNLNRAKSLKQIWRHGHWILDISINEPDCGQVLFRQFLIPTCDPSCIPGAVKLGSHVRPGERFTYKWQVRDGLFPDDPPCVSYLYFSATDPVRDTNSGLVGPLKVCKTGTLDANSSPSQVCICAPVHLPHLRAYLHVFTLQNGDISKCWILWIHVKHS